MSKKNKSDVIEIDSAVIVEIPVSIDAPETVLVDKPKSGRGRPKGSTNKARVDTKPTIFGVSVSNYNELCLTLDNNAFQVVYTTPGDIAKIALESAYVTAESASTFAKALQGLPSSAVDYDQFIGAFKGVTPSQNALIYTWYNSPK